MSRLILASQSPQRRTLLESLGLEFEVKPSTVDEESEPEQDPKRRPLHLSRLKAMDVAREHPEAWVIGCDTIVVSPQGLLLEKPVDAHDARRMIRAQSGGTSVVHSGLTIVGPGGVLADGLSSSHVRFAALTDAQLEWWIATGLWQGRSGAFQIDGLGQLMIEQISGDWTSIVGLPVYLLGQLAAKVEAPFAYRVVH